MLATARLLGQTLGAAGVAILFRASSSAGANMALWAGAGIALAAAVVSLSRLAAPRGTLPPDQSLTG
jgi:DHA2 family multidrug resistance protein-like MFS transporter